MSKILETYAGLGKGTAIAGMALGAATDNDPSTVVDWNALIPAILTGIGLLFVRDGDKSTEDSVQ